MHEFHASNEGGGRTWAVCFDALQSHMHRKLANSLCTIPNDGQLHQLSLVYLPCFWGPCIIFWEYYGEWASPTCRYEAGVVRGYFFSNGPIQWTEIISLTFGHVNAGLWTLSIPTMPHSIIQMISHFYLALIYWLTVVAQSGPLLCLTKDWGSILPNFRGLNLVQQSWSFICFLIYFS
jgi:hypothetical protein